MTTFLRLEIFGRRDDQPAQVVLVNVQHIVRIHPTWPSGCNIISSEVDEVSLHVTASLDELQAVFVAAAAAETHPGYAVQQHEHVDVAYEIAPSGPAAMNVARLTIVGALLGPSLFVVPTIASADNSPPVLGGPAPTVTQSVTPSAPLAPTLQTRRATRRRLRRSPQSFAMPLWQCE